MGGPATDAPAPPPNEPRRPRFSTRQYIIGAAIGVVVLIAVALFVRYESGSDRRRYEAILKATLDRVVTAQEGFYYDSTHYTSSLTALPAVQLPPGVHVQITSPDRRSWWAMAWHDRLRDRICRVWVGTPPATFPREVSAPEDETKPSCGPSAYFIMPRASRS